MSGAKSGDRQECLGPACLASRPRALRPLRPAAVPSLCRAPPFFLQSAAFKSPCSAGPRSDSDLSPEPQRELPVWPHRLPGYQGVRRLDSCACAGLARLCAGRGSGHPRSGRGGSGEEGCGPQSQAGADFGLVRGLRPFGTLCLVLSTQFLRWYPDHSMC